MTLCPTHLLDHPEGCPWCVVDSLTHSGNGEVIRNWMKAHGKAMDRLEEAEEKLRLSEVEIYQVKKDYRDLHAWTAAQCWDHLLGESAEKAYRAGYRDGATAVNTVGPDALDHVEMHLKKWSEEK